jgi:hypothetical protein
MSVKDYTIAIEVQPMTVPKPVGFDVMADRRPVAFLTEDQLREALARFDALKAEYDASRARRGMS